MSATIYEPGEGIRTIDLAGTTVTAKADGAATRIRLRRRRDALSGLNR